jgi:hypothetical protein
LVQNGAQTSENSTHEMLTEEEEDESSGHETDLLGESTSGSVPGSRRDRRVAASSDAVGLLLSARMAPRPSRLASPAMARARSLAAPSPRGSSAPASPTGSPSTPEARGSSASARGTRQLLNPLLLTATGARDPLCIMRMYTILHHVRSLGHPEVLLK